MHYRLQLQTGCQPNAQLFHVISQVSLEDFVDVEILHACE